MTKLSLHSSPYTLGVTSINNSVICNKMQPMILLLYQVNPFGMLARLAHANGQFVKNVISICNIPIASKELYGFCKSCCVGKSHRLHSPLSITIQIGRAHV